MRLRLTVVDTTVFYKTCDLLPIFDWYGLLFEKQIRESCHIACNVTRLLTVALDVSRMISKIRDVSRVKQQYLTNQSTDVSYLQIKFKNQLAQSVTISVTPIINLRSVTPGEANNIKGNHSSQSDVQAKRRLKWLQQLACTRLHIQRHHETIIHS